MDNDLIIRRARTEDARVLIDNNIAMALETESRDIDPITAKEGVHAVIKDAAKGFYVVAVQTGEVVGQCMITLEWSDWRNGDFWWIQSVYVRPELRGRGIFSKIYQHVLEEARRRVEVVGLRLYVERGNRPAKEIYSHLGIKPSHYEMYEIDFTRGRTEPQ
jgi:GNAT superfamily N-acetyltransferase